MKTSTRLRVYQMIGYLTAPPREVVFSPHQPRPRRLLFLFPIQNQLVAESRYVARRLQRYLHRNTICLAISNLYRDRISCPLHSTFYFPMHPDDPTRIQMDVMLARFRNQAFDAVINLDPELNFQIARVMSVIDTPRRIGLSGPYADDLYNIHIYADPDQPLRKAYAQMLKLCDLGTPGG
ncbi:MAG: hypothetical protein ACETWG_03860 [Candidatus Neomarinimicrobiota bacterium]